MTDGPTARQTDTLRQQRHAMHYTVNNTTLAEALCKFFEVISKICLWQRMEWLCLYNFDDTKQKYSKYYRVVLACFSFHVGLLVINFPSFKADTGNNADFDAVSSKFANFDEVQFL